METERLKLRTYFWLAVVISALVAIGCSNIRSAMSPTSNCMPERIAETPDGTVVWKIGRGTCREVVSRDVFFTSRGGKNGN